MNSSLFYIYFQRYKYKLLHHLKETPPRSTHDFHLHHFLFQLQLFLLHPTTTWPANNQFLSKTHQKCLKYTWGGGFPPIWQWSLISSPSFTVMSANCTRKVGSLLSVELWTPFEVISELSSHFLLSGTEFIIKFN